MAAILAGTLRMLALQTVDSTLNFSASKWNHYTRCAQELALLSGGKRCGEAAGPDALPNVNRFSSVSSHTS